MADITFIKDPSAKLDYHFVWTNILPFNVLISAGIITADSGVTVANSAVNSSEITIGKKSYPAGTVVSCTIAGGTDGVEYVVTCEIDMDDANALNDKRTFTLVVRNR